MADEESPRRTPPLLYLLGILVVVAIWLIWSDRLTSRSAELERWRAEKLDLREIAKRLEDTDEGAISHGLVQLARVVDERRGEDGASAELLALLPALEALPDRVSPPVRELLVVGVTYVPDERAGTLLHRLLADADPKVALNAAIGLAARNDAAGADRLQEAIAGTSREQAPARRALLAAFRHVAQPRHAAFLEDELRAAELDRDEEAVAACRAALARVAPDGSPR